MRAILINPIDHTVTEVEHNGDYRQIYEFIDARLFDVARINEHGDGIYVDDEGLFNSVDLFHLQGYPEPLAGKGLVLGCDEEGNSTAPTVTADWVRENITWLFNFGGMLVEVRDAV